MKKLSTPVVVNLIKRRNSMLIFLLGLIIGGIHPKVTIHITAHV
ncbi:hypothetical protein [Cytobacillus stercorigallinarum]|nr:hypothetical protein [Cytobacillus stercorigallinarum]